MTTGTTTGKPGRTPGKGKRVSITLADLDAQTRADLVRELRASRESTEVKPIVTQAVQALKRAGLTDLAKHLKQFAEANHPKGERSFQTVAQATYYAAVSACIWALALAVENGAHSGAQTGSADPAPLTDAQAQAILALARKTGRARREKGGQDFSEADFIAGAGVALMALGAGNKLPSGWVFYAVAKEKGLDVLADPAPQPGKAA